MSYLEKIADFFQSIADSLWIVLLVALPLCVSISAVNAFIRKLSDVGSNAFLELQWYLFSAVFLLGAGTVLKHDGHIRIDIFYAKMRETTKAKINIMLHLFLTIPMLVFLIYLSTLFFLTSIAPAHAITSLMDVFCYLFKSEFHEVSANAGGLPTWYAKILMPLGFILLLCAVIADIIRHYVMFKKSDTYLTKV